MLKVSIRFFSQLRMPAEELTSQGITGSDDAPYLWALLLPVLTDRSRVTLLLTEKLFPQQVRSAFFIDAQCLLGAAPGKQGPLRKFLNMLLNFQ